MLRVLKVAPFILALVLMRSPASRPQASAASVYQALQHRIDSLESYATTCETVRLNESSRCQYRWNRPDHAQSLLHLALVDTREATATLVGIQAVNGRNCYELSFSNKSQLWVDTSTYDLVKWITIQDGAPVVRVFSPLQRLDGRDTTLVTRCE